MDKYVRNIWGTIRGMLVKNMNICTFLYADDAKLAENPNDLQPALEL